MEVGKIGGLVMVSGELDVGGGPVGLLAGGGYELDDPAQELGSFVVFVLEQMGRGMQGRQLLDALAEVVEQFPIVFFGAFALADLDPQVVVGGGQLGGAVSDPMLQFRVG